MITIEGRAKINLTLDILRTREDGFHEVAMVMQAVGLADTLTLEKREAPGIGLVIDVPWLRANEKNLAYRAAKLMQEEYHLPGGVAIHLTKRIPMAAGLAGGSADAAAVLRGMDALYELGAGDEKLCELGARLGSDIPFTLMGGTMLATGRGEVLRRLPDFPETYVVLAKPHVSVSTAWAYGAYDAHPAERHPDNDAMIRAIEAGARRKAASFLCNVLESATIKRYEVISKLKEMMKEAGAFASLMSGSGPTVFGFAETREQAEKVAEAVRLPDVDVFVTKTVGCNTK
ncbi:MAG: 4-(cytidine 5'-diphospho)-2-C-methyl-D-erythritol kinase [Selenomonas sp.]|uniref:4-(cytidine 5'-diphospho)-2-C-methyl-D-erythritol kinase n=1 Tax=Selenomonas sp. TaxID=2053611 RepID=UPI0025D1584C|nr:4-(cytidine 5'-diphospho)-2-C-methyl-D-erythritol kinase [Selenomonas sp.]MCI6101092.1 4-(cytidine 5'-diphospho)-2-C-methyl-D-erythritol kinase [Selenomonas sp.]MCI6231495.1 4-(cytidine 5'-diphospho)-2-C-methyl-D-erythritol kinase [Selenomonas sp.]